MKIRKVLEFYADEDNHTRHYDETTVPRRMPSRVSEDDGARAREALAALDDKEAMKADFVSHYMDRFGHPEGKIEWRDGEPFYTPPESSWPPMATDHEEHLESEWAAWQAAHSRIGGGDA